MGHRVGFEFTWAEGIFRICQIVDILKQNNFFLSEEEAANGLLEMLKSYPVGYDEVTERILNGKDTPRITRSKGGYLGGMEAEYILDVIGRRIAPVGSTNNIGFISSLGIDLSTGEYCLKIKFDSKMGTFCISKYLFESNYVVSSERI
jgi:hypothetical protein